METKEIQENNKLIAEFMDMRFDENKYSHVSSEYYFEACELEFHFNWNWLMPVVEKIESLGHGVTIYRNGCQINDFTIISHHFRHKSKINEVYKAVVGFIKWYNENKQDNENN